MKKFMTKYLLIIAISSAFLTGCYTQVATQDDSNSSYYTTDTYDNYIYEGEQENNSGYFDETDTVDNNYYYEGEDSAEGNNGTVINNYYYDYNPYYPQSYYDYYYPSWSFSFGFGFGYPYYF